MTFTTTRRVDFGDTDMAGIMHFANFFRFMESAEIDFLHTVGLTVSWREGTVKWGFPRVSVSCDFQKPARFEDVLSIAVSVEKLGGEVGLVSLRLQQSEGRGDCRGPHHRGVLPIGRPRSFGVGRDAGGDACEVGTAGEELTTTENTEGTEQEFKTQVCFRVFRVFRGENLSW